MLTEMLRSAFKKWRLVNKLTIRDVEKLTGISNAYISQFENGKSKDIGLNNAEKLFICIMGSHEKTESKTMTIKPSWHERRDKLAEEYADQFVDKRNEHWWMKEPYNINPTTGECTLTKMSKEPDKIPNAQGSWGIGMYSTLGNGEADGYGFMRTPNPNNFFPDYESCEPWEIANHKLACELYNKGEWTDK